MRSNDTTGQTLMAIIALVVLSTTAINLINALGI